MLHSTITIPSVQMAYSAQCNNKTVTKTTIQIQCLSLFVQLHTRFSAHISISKSQPKCHLKFAILIFIARQVSSQLQFVHKYLFLRVSARERLFWVFCFLFYCFTFFGWANMSVCLWLAMPSVYCSHFIHFFLGWNKTVNS